MAINSTRSRFEGQSNFPFMTRPILVTYYYRNVPKTLISSHQENVSKSPSSSLDVTPSYSIPCPAELPSSQSLLQIHAIARVLICTKRTYCSLSDLLLLNRPSTNIPKLPPLQLFCKHNMVACTIALISTGVIWQQFSQISTEVEYHTSDLLIHSRIRKKLG